MKDTLYTIQMETYTIHMKSYTIQKKCYTCTIQMEKMEYCNVLHAI